MSETLTMANPVETEKIRTHHAKIVVECTTGEPYYSIEWFDTAKQEYCLGYSSYYIDNVLGWLKEFFEIVEAPKTNADRIRAMSDEELAQFLADEIPHGDCCGCKLDCSTSEGDMFQSRFFHECDCYNAFYKWLKQPAEEGADYG